MPILEKERVKVYRTGDAVTATVINDTIDTAIDSHEKSVNALEKSTSAETASQKGYRYAEDALARASSAEMNSENALNYVSSALAKSGTAETNSQNAYNYAKDAQTKAESAETNAQNALSNSQNALNQSATTEFIAQNALANSELAVTTSNDASIKSALASNDASEAKNNAASALILATEVVARADSGEFHGTGAMIDTSGMYGLQVIDGNLILNYSGDVEPNFAINADGELLFVFEGD